MEDIPTKMKPEGTLPTQLRMYRTAPLPNTTPQRRKHCSTNLLNEKYDLDTLDSVLTGELANEPGPHRLSDQNILKRIFSDKALGFPISNDIVKRLVKLGAFLEYDSQIAEETESYDTTDALFFQKNVRRRPGWEAQMARHLNHFGKVIAEVTKCPIRREWTSARCQTPLSGSPHDRKPDIILCPTGTKTDKLYHWRQVDGVLETSSTVAPAVKIRNTVMAKAFCMYTEQHARRYIVNAWIVGGRFGLAYYDRSGEVVAEYFYKSQHNLVRLIAGLMFGTDQLLGYDPTVLRQDGHVTDVYVVGNRYQVVCTLFTSQVLRGRGTVCWLAKKDGQVVVIKDTWVDKDRQWEEASFLEECKGKGIDGVPTVIDKEDVLIDGKPDSTLARRDPKTDWTQVEDRAHRRLVTSPLCIPLSSFSSKSELMQGFIDILESTYFLLSGAYNTDVHTSAHRQLIRIGILHRDLSLNNLAFRPANPRPTCGVFGPNAISSTNPDMVSFTPPAPLTTPGSRRGMILDFDYALWVSPSDKAGGYEPSKKDRTVSCLQILDSGPLTCMYQGTVPFMSVELLDPPPDAAVPNTFQHDLETLFYVFVWICSIYQSPGRIRDEDPDLSDSLVILKWNQDKNPKEIGEIKRSHMSYGGIKLSACFSPYFASFKPFCIQIFDVLFPKGSEARSDHRASLSPVTHEEIIAIFHKALKHALEEEQMENLDTGDPHTLRECPAPKRRRGNIADPIALLPAQKRQHILADVFNTEPLHQGDIGIDPLPTYVRPRRKRARYY